MRAGDHRLGLHVRARVGAGVEGESQRGEVGVGPEDGRQWPNAPGGVGLGKHGWEGVAADVGKVAGGGPALGGGVGRGVGRPPCHPWGRPRGGGRPIRGDSAGRGWPPPAGRAYGGGGGWDSAAALDPEDHESPRCPHGDRRRGNSSSARVVGGGARSPWPRLRLAQPGVRAFLGAGPGLRAAPPKRVVRGASGSGREVPRGPGDAEGRAPRPLAPRCFSSLGHSVPSGRPSGPQAPRGLRPPPLPAVARGSLGEGGLWASAPRARALPSRAAFAPGPSRAARCRRWWPVRTCPTSRWGGG